MTRDQRNAHLRLLESLPSTVHYANLTYANTPRNMNGKGGFRWRKAVVVDGVRYPSISHAAKKTGRSRQAIYQRIQRRNGARYADDV